MRVKPVTVILAWISSAFYLLVLILLFLLLAMMAAYNPIGLLFTGIAIAMYLLYAIPFVIVTFFISKNQDDHQKAKGAIIALLVIGIISSNILAIIGGAIGLTPDNSKNNNRIIKTHAQTQSNLEAKLLELNKLYAAGTISAEEYQNARTKVILNHN